LRPTRIREFTMIDKIRHYHKKCGILLCSICIAMYIMIALSTAAIVLTLFQKCCYCTFTPTLDGITYFLYQFKPFYPLFSGTFLLITIFVALVTYVHSKKVDAMKALQDLRNMLMIGDNMEIHDLLEYEKEDEKEKHDLFKEKFAKRQGTIYNYIGILELSKFYLDEDIISVEQFKDQFGYRIENIYANPMICEWIKKHPEYWRTLDALKKIATN